RTTIIENALASIFLSKCIAPTYADQSSVSRLCGYYDGGVYGIECPSIEVDYHRRYSLGS
ncbi:MAG: hypothetical protein ACE5KV_07205, partial [Thermoplasmata archaeon]